MCECELCRNLAFDDEEEDYECMAEFDEDEIAKMWQEGSRSHCPNWKSNENEYQTVKYQAIGHLAIEGKQQLLLLKRKRMLQRKRKSWQIPLPNKWQQKSVPKSCEPQITEKIIR